MGGMARSPLLRVRGAADSWMVHFRVVPAAPGAMFAGTAGIGRSVQSRSTWSAAWGRWVGRWVMRCVRVQPGCLQIQPCSIARFGDSCRGCWDRIVGLQWPVVSGRWPGTAGIGARRSDARSVGDAHRLTASSPRRVGDELEPRTYGGIHLPVAAAKAGDAQARWHGFRGALRGESSRTREGRNGRDS